MPNASSGTAVDKYRQELADVLSTKFTDVPDNDDRDYGYVEEYEIMEQIGVLFFTVKLIWIGLCIYDEDDRKTGINYDEKGI